MERLFAYGPLPGSALMDTLVSHQGTCCIESDLLTRCMQEGFADVMATGDTR